MLLIIEKKIKLSNLILLLGSILLGVLGPLPAKAQFSEYGRDGAAHDLKIYDSSQVHRDQ